MKKTLTVNLNNVVFHIDDDAYEMLQTYLSDVEKHLSDDEKKEVMSDIEARVAELFTERLQKNKNVVNLDDVVEIINVLGKPSQYADGEEETDAPPRSEKKRARRYYRDPENSVLGGVAGGLAAYMGWDVTVLRILFVVLVFLGVGMIIPVYIIIWLIAPAATTVSQRLEMQGEDVTVDSIKSEINNVKNYVESDKFKDSANNVGRRLGEILGWIFKAIFGFVGAILGFVGIIVVGVLLLVLLFFIFEPAVFNGFSPEIMTDWALLTPDKAVMLIISVLLVVGCPIFMVIYWAIRMISGRKDFSKTTSWVVFILWLAGLFMFYSVGAKTIIHWNKTDHPWVIDFNDDNTPYVEEVRNVDKFHGIEISGNVELEFTQDSTTEVRISAPEGLMSRIATKVEDGILKIYSEKLILNRSIKVYISNDSLFHIKASGASIVRTNNKLFTSHLYLDANGASNVKMDVDVKDKFEIDASGASYCDVDGIANKIILDISGASKVEADQLTAKYADVESSGAAHARVFATEAIDADASGAASIDCEGSPKTVDKSQSGGASVSVK